MRYNGRAAFLAFLGIASAVVVCALPPIPQWKGYHDFADGRPFGAIPNAWNVLSNLPFLIVGVLGLREAYRRDGGVSVRREERLPQLILMASFVFVFLGSSLYHWRPDDRTLFWDRLPLALLFTSFLGITLIERVSPRWGTILLGPLLAAGAAGVVWWSLRGDLRFYFATQAVSVLAIPLIIALFPARYTGTRELLLVVALYGFAKLFEALDAPVYQAGHLVSGHTLKHLLGAAAAGVYVRMLRRRRPIESPQTLVAPAPQA